MREGGTRDPGTLALISALSPYETCRYGQKRESQLPSGDRHCRFSGTLAFSGGIKPRNTAALHSVSWTFIRRNRPTTAMIRRAASAISSSVSIGLRLKRIAE